MSNKTIFVNRNLEELVKNDKYVSREFLNENGERFDSDDPEYLRRKDLLAGSLDDAYNLKMGDKYDRKHFMQRFVATPLRYLALGLYGAGTGLFLTGLGPLGFGLTGAGMGTSTLADAIDSYYYTKQGRIRGRQLASVWGEGLPEKVLGYLPIGTGLIDWYRGRKKFDDATRRNLKPLEREARDYARDDFLRKIRVKEKDGRKIIPIEAFKDRRYSEVKKAAA